LFSILNILVVCYFKQCYTKRTFNILNKVHFMDYDGTTNLQPAIAELLKLSVNNQAGIAKAVKQAKVALNMDTAARRLPAADKLAIWQWHVDRLAVQDIKQPLHGNDTGHDADDGNVTDTTADTDNDVQDVKQPDTVDNSPPVQDIKQTNADNAVQDIKQNDNDKGVYDVKQPEQVSDFAQVHFAVNLGSKRTTVMLDGYLVNALKHKHGLDGNASIRQWLQSVVDADTRFDINGRVTPQTMRLIVESLSPAPLDAEAAEFRRRGRVTSALIIGHNEWTVEQCLLALSEPELVSSRGLALERLGELFGYRVTAIGDD
jgi:hypothetical protein